FDGFDEMAARVDRQKMIDNFWELARVLVPGAKAILTCRTEHFPDAREGRALLGAKLKDSIGTFSTDAPQFEVIELKMFNDRQIQQLLEKKHVPKGVIDSIISKPDIMDMARRPLLAEYILDAQPDLQAGASVDLARIYLYAIRRKMKEDISQERTFSSMADKLYFLCEISWEMLSRDASGLNYREFPTRLRNLFGEGIQSSKNLDYWRYDMMGQTLLIRNDDGDYSMAHRSLAEFFCAYKFVAELGVLDSDFFELAKQQSDIDQSMMPKQYTWATYFKRQLSADGTAELKAPAKEFMTEDITVSGIARDMVDIERLSPNAIVFASYMVSKDAAALAKLCSIAWQQTGLLARNALYLIPYLKTEHSATLSKLLVDSSEGGPLGNGICWLLGELGVKSEEVKSALRRTVSLFALCEHTNSHAWWESGFALEKLGEFDGTKAAKGKRPIEYLGRHLPADADLDNSLKNIRKAVEATTTKDAMINQADIVVIVSNRKQVDIAELYHILEKLDFSFDCLDRRVYYSVWLCGHLAIKQSLNNIIKATTRPQGSVRNTACEALGKSRIVDPIVINALEKCLSDSYYRTRIHAAEALAALKAHQSLPVLQRHIRFEEVRVVREEMINSQNLLLKIFKQKK
ncbi:MAG: NACHT domain-containing protein, partial [Promethearchaeota archaeon]